MKQIVKLEYFKFSGKYYSGGEYETDKRYFHEVINEVRQLKLNGKLPGLVEGAREFMVLIEAQEPWNVPHIIP